MHKMKLNSFENLCKILDTKTKIEDAEINVDFGKKYLYAKKMIIWYTNLQRSKLLELKAEASDGDYSKYYTMMVAQIAMFLTLFQMLIPVVPKIFIVIKEFLISSIIIKW